MNNMVLKIASGSRVDPDMVRQLNNLAVRGLAEMFDVEKQLFCFRVKRNDYGVMKEGFSFRYTIISLLGLHRIKTQGMRSPVNIQTALDKLLENTGNIQNIGDIGLLLWLCALASPQRLIRIYSELDIKSALRRYSDARQGRTMELAWFLTGLAYTALILKDEPAGLADLAANTYRLLRNNYGGKGIFSHLNRTSFTSMIRGQIGSFADQVYPVYALARFAQVYNSKEAIKMALDCAKTICRLQGPLGQWWWHYNSLTGRTVGQYPVYAVHQDGMAPMALSAIGEVTGIDFSESIYKGLEWITGSNELGYDLIDTSQNIIWRSFYRKKYKMYCDEILSLLRFPRGKNSYYKDINVNFECRPYHLGWILYAFATEQ